MKRAIATTIFCTFFALSGCTNQPEESSSDGGGRSADVALTEQEMEELVKRSYPYVAMFNVNNKFALDADNPMNTGGYNRVKANTDLTDHTVQAIARPNNDTLYVVAMVDVTKEPIVMEMPAFDSKYVSLMVAAYDHYVNIPMSTGDGDFDKPSTILFYSERTPGYDGKPVKGVDEVFEVTGDFVGATLRVMPHAAEPKRLEAIRAAMRSVKLKPLSKFLGKEGGTGSALAPKEDLARFPKFGSDFEIFEDRFLETMQFVVNHTTFDPDNELDEALLKILEPLGVAPGKTFDPKTVVNIDGADLRKTAERISAEYLAKMDDEDFLAANLTKLFQPKGDMTVDVLAFQSVVGPVGQPARQAVYPSISTEDGKPMNAMHDYEIVMASDTMPPAKAFWSVTLYDTENGFFIPNDRKKYSVGENAGFKPDEKGGIRIVISAEQPEGVPEENWLPIERKDVDLNVIMRIYSPDLEKFTNWEPPKAKRIDLETASAGGDAERVGEVLPFPAPPMGGKVGPTMQESVHKWREAPSHLPEDAPNILIVMLDDVGFGQASTFGGEINTPTLSRLAKEGIAYNRFHTTAMCSPTRAALMTGRNHHRVGAGQIAEFANDWDGYTGVIPKSSATVSEVLGHYGYATSAFGKDHNTPVDQIANGPYDRTPTGRGFDYFYGFIAGETSQWEPVLWENTTRVSPPHVENHEDYHLTEDMADKAITWMRRHLAVNPDRPFLMWWTPGAVHGPHHVASEWADKYKGKFDDGWDAYQQRTFERQKAMGWIPADTQLAPRPEGIPAWKDVPEDEKAFQARLMEVFAGFLEHTDVQVGKVIDELDARGIRDNTIVIYILGDNGASAEGMEGSVAELNAQNGIASTVAEHIAVVEQLGGLDAIGGPKMDNMYHSAWAWAGDSPFRYTKLVASDWGGTRTPMVISWPNRIKPDKTPRSQFLHVNDVVPTLYDILDITPPKVVDGHEQDPLDGVSFASTFDSADAPEVKKTQYFEIMGSRGIYHEGWMASTFGPRTPWVATMPDISKWDPEEDEWQLFDTRSDYSLMNNLASENPRKLEEMKALFMQEARENKVLPVGGGLLTILNPTEMKVSTNTEWTLFEGMTRIPESQAPNVRNGNLRVEIEAEVPKDVNGVIFAMGGYAGGVSLYALNGELYYEYSALLLKRDKIKVGALPTGEVKIAYEMHTPRGRDVPAELTFWINGKETTKGTLRRTVPGGFTASETFDVGMDLCSPVADAYFDKAPFKFEGTLKKLHFKYLEQE